MNSLPTAKDKQVTNDTENKALNSEADRERFNFTRLLRIVRKILDRKDTTENFTQERN